MCSSLKALRFVLICLAIVTAASAGRTASVEKKTTKTVKKAQKSSKAKSVEYIVEFGDTLYTIAHKHHTTVAELCEANDMNRSSVIKMGQKLTVPTNTYFPEREKKEAKKAPKKKSASSGKIKTEKTKGKKKKKKKKGPIEYTIEFGDTLYIIAHKHHTTVAEVCKANDIDRNSMIRVGQVLRVPVNTYTPPDGKKEQGDKGAGKKKNGDSKNAGENSTKKKEEKNPNEYIVESGDTLFSIARKLRVPLKELMTTNDIGPTGVIKVGQKLKISESGYRKPAAEKKEAASVKKKQKTIVKETTYTVKKGDTLWKIAKKHKLTLKEIRKLNNMKKKDVIHKGMKLVVKRVELKEKKIKRYYTVKKGDTLWKIAKKHKLTLKEIRKLNNMKKKDVIHKGMKLVVGTKTVKIAAGENIKQKTAHKGKKRARAKEKKKKKSKLASADRKKSKKRSKKRNSAMDALKGKNSERYTRASKNIIRTAKRYLGKRYVWGAEGPNQFDCSGFTQYVMRKSKGVEIPRISRRQAYYGKYVSRRNLRPGDLIFFDTSRRRRGYVNHVGIYIGNNKFIHASSARHRVVITSLERPFYKARFKWGRRIN